MLSHRINSLLSQIGTDTALQSAQNYKVIVTPVGAVVALSANSSTITVDPGHGFMAGDRFLRNPGTDNQLSGVVASVSPSTLVMGAAVWAVEPGDVLVNLGPDGSTGSTPNYDQIPTEEFSDPSGSTRITNSIITTGATGNYEYWTRGLGGVWELILDASQAPVGVIRGWGAATQLSVADYGAIGDGQTECGGRLNRAVRAAIDIGGHRLHIPDGTFITAETILYGTNSIVEGDGVSSAVQADASLGAGLILMAPVGLGVGDAILRDFMLDQRSDVYGDAANKQCLSVDGTIRCRFERLSFRNVQTMAVWADTSSGDGAQTSSLVIRDCTVLNSRGGGISLFGNLADVDVSDNTIRNCQDDGIAVQEGTDGDKPVRITVIGNSVVDCNTRNGLSSTPNGIRIFGCWDVVVADNVISDTVSCGISVSKSTTHRCKNVTITGNVINNAGITTDDTSGVPGSGIWALWSDDLVISGNVVRGSRGAGIEVRGVDGATVASCSRVSISGNVCEDNGADGVLVRDVVDFTVVGNVCMNNGTSGSEPNGILIDGTAAFDGTGADGSLQGTLGGVVVGNRCGDSQEVKTQQYGIQFAGSSGYIGPVFVGYNDCSGNGTNGIGDLVSWWISLGRNQGDDATAGGGTLTHRERYVGPNAESVQIASKTVLVTVEAAAYTAVANFLPGNSVIEAITGYVVATIPGAATFSVGDTGLSTRFGSGIDAGAGVAPFVGTDHLATEVQQVSNEDLRITPNTVPTDNTGRVRLVCYYRTYVAPST